MTSRCSIFCTDLLSLPPGLPLHLLSNSRRVCATHVGQYHKRWGASAAEAIGPLAFSDIGGTSSSVRQYHPDFIIDIPAPLTSCFDVYLRRGGPWL